MLNTAKSRAEIKALPGDRVSVMKVDLFAIYDQVDIGNDARRALRNIATIANLGVSNMRPPA